MPSPYISMLVRPPVGAGASPRDRDGNADQQRGFALGHRPRPGYDAQGRELTQREKSIRPGALRPVIDVPAVVRPVTSRPIGELRQRPVRPRPPMTLPGEPDIPAPVANVGPAADPMQPDDAPPINWELYYGGGYTGETDEFGQPLYPDYDQDYGQGVQVATPADQGLQTAYTQPQPQPYAQSGVQDAAIDWNAYFDGGSLLDSSNSLMQDNWALPKMDSGGIFSYTFDPYADQLMNYGYANPYNFGGGDQAGYYSQMQYLFPNTYGQYFPDSYFQSYPAGQAPGSWNPYGMPLDNLLWSQQYAPQSQIPVAPYGIADPALYGQFYADPYSGFGNAFSSGVFGAGASNAGPVYLDPNTGDVITPYDSQGSIVQGNAVNDLTDFPDTTPDPKMLDVARKLVDLMDISDDARAKAKADVNTGTKANWGQALAGAMNGLDAKIRAVDTTQFSNFLPAMLAVQQGQIFLQYVAAVMQGRGFGYYEPGVAFMITRAQDFTDGLAGLMKTDENLKYVLTRNNWQVGAEALFQSQGPVRLIGEGIVNHAADLAKGAAEGLKNNAGTLIPIVVGGAIGGALLLGLGVLALLSLGKKRK